MDSKNYSQKPQQSLFSNWYAIVYGNFYNYIILNQAVLYLDLFKLSPIHDRN